MMEVLQGLAIAIWTVFRWRLVLSLAAAVALSVTLSNLFIGFTAGYCVTLVMFAAAFGIYWQSQSEIGEVIKGQMLEQKISRPIQYVGLSFFGLVWGCLINEFLRSETLAIASLMFFSAVVGVWHAVVLRQPIALQTMAFSTFALLSGFLTLLTVIHLYA